MKPRKSSAVPRMLSLLLVTMPLWTSGCAPGPASSPVVVPGSNPCATLPLPAYSHAFNGAVADELAALPPGAALRTVVHDYVAERDAIKACRSVKP